MLKTTKLFDVFTKDFGLNYSYKTCHMKLTL